MWVAKGSDRTEEATQHSHFTRNALQHQWGGILSKALTPRLWRLDDLGSLFICIHLVTQSFNIQATGIN